MSELLQYAFQVVGTTPVQLNVLEQFDQVYIAPTAEAAIMYCRHARPGCTVIKVMLGHPAPVVMPPKEQALVN
jgi:hypothetical protein